MTLVLIAAGAVVLVLTVPILLDRYLARLPDAPGCPVCHAVTRVSGPPPLETRLVPLLDTVSVRRCTACGWHGRMRWRWAAEQVREG